MRIIFKNTSVDQSIKNIIIENLIDEGQIWQAYNKGRTIIPELKTPSLLILQGVRLAS